MATTLINPPDLATPRGFSHGAIGTGRLLFVAGQTGTDKEGKLVSDDLVTQFDRALSSVVISFERRRDQLLFLRANRELARERQETIERRLDAMVTRAHAPFPHAWFRLHCQLLRWLRPNDGVHPVRGSAPPDNQSFGVMSGKLRSRR